MGKYSSVSRPTPPPRNREVHPLMRGIGCLMLVIVPILAYGVSVLLVNYGMQRGWPIPPPWLEPAQFHPLLWSLSGLVPVLNFLQAQPHLTANLVFAVGISVVAFGVMSVMYGYIYKLFGPPEYGPTDEPPVRGAKIKRYKR